MPDHLEPDHDGEWGDSLWEQKPSQGEGDDECGSLSFELGEILSNADGRPCSPEEERRRQAMIRELIRRIDGIRVEQTPPPQHERDIENGRAAEIAPAANAAMSEVSDSVRGVVSESEEELRMPDGSVRRTRQKEIDTRKTAMDNIADIAKYLISEFSDRLRLCIKVKGFELRTRSFGISAGDVEVQIGKSKAEGKDGAPKP